MNPIFSRQKERPPRQALRHGFAGPQTRTMRTASMFLSRATLKASPVDGGRCLRAAQTQQIKNHFLSSALKVLLDEKKGHTDVLIYRTDARSSIRYGNCILHREEDNVFMLLYNKEVNNGLHRSGEIPTLSTERHEPCRGSLRTQG